MGVGSVLLLFMFAFVYSKITLQIYEVPRIISTANGCTNVNRINIMSILLTSKRMNPSDEKLQAFGHFLGEQCSLLHITYDEVCSELGISRSTFSAV